jgi:hypothetical protein
MSGGRRCSYGRVLENAADTNECARQKAWHAHAVNYLSRLWRFTYVYFTPSAPAPSLFCYSCTMSSAARSRAAALLALSSAALMLLLLAALSTVPSSILAVAPPPLHPAAPTPTGTLSHVLSSPHHPPPEITARVLARARSEEVGGSPSAAAQDVPVQAYVNKIEHLRALRAAKAAAAHRLHERDSFIGAINAGKLLDQFE